ncbi:hypothetical protein KY084_10325 [Stakelama sp. CBK3Z-3]|uniref:Uncharacterized protein n=1 Tax=Stakelama flava TaxID=2860338 RepID=A0ABS6XM26_9SPHN|nr:hypothetical protein [Stakelama flava]MBW4331267.1 hypothetical protein [Stakelama flava]
MPTQYREIRSAALLIAILSVYYGAVVASGRVASDELIKLSAVYLGGAAALWAVLGLIGLLAMLARHGILPTAGQRPLLQHLFCDI